MHTYKDEIRRRKGQTKRYADKQRYIQTDKTSTGLTRWADREETFTPGPASTKELS